VSVSVIDEKSQHLDSIRVLWRDASDTLGFFPDGAFADHARNRWILVAQDSSEACVGYLLYRVAKERAVIVHLCVAEQARGQGHARNLVEHLIGITSHLRGVGLLCRRDFPAYHLWPQLGFAPIYEKAGRAVDGTDLTYFWLSHNQPDLFAASKPELEAVIDSNVFLDLVEFRNAESQCLLADWLQDLVRLCLTLEHFTEFDRSGDASIRKKRRNQAAYYHRLESDAAEHNKATLVLAPLFPNLKTPQDKSDFSHLVRALAAGAWAFVTRDEQMLQRADEVYAVCGLSVVRPAELIGRIDELLHEKDYQRFQVAGTNSVFRRKTSAVDNALIGAIKSNSETKRHLLDDIRPYLANPQRFTCTTIRDRDENPLAFYVVERQAKLDVVHLIRLSAHRLEGTLARTVLTQFAYTAAKDGQAGVLVAEPCATDNLRLAYADLGYLSSQAGYLKLTMSDVIPAANLACKLEGLELQETSVGHLVDLLRSPLTPHAASEVEHILWPAKVADADLPTFIVPIRPAYAQHLFDEGLAKQSLLGGDIDLALNPESVYYRAARPQVVEFPGRILWYVSKDAKFDGSMSIRGCSRIAEVCIDKPKTLFKRFQRLGVYQWSDLVQTAKGDYDQDIMAIRFHDTEPLRRIKWDTFQAILKNHEINTQLQSPCRVPPHVFKEIYALAVGASALR
jgi:GNAT superfamily N-acetyltransferase